MQNLIQLYHVVLKKNDLSDFAIFSHGSHLGISTRLNFIILKPCGLVILHVNCFDIFYIGAHLGFSIRLNFTILKPCSLIMLHVEFEKIWVSKNKSLKWT